VIFSLHKNSRQRWQVLQTLFLFSEQHSLFGAAGRPTADPDFVTNCWQTEPADWCSSDSD